MSQEQWTAVDDYITDLFIPADPALDAAIEATSAAGMPPINVAPNQGKLLQILALAHGARRILEIGTLAGYSTIWLARALPNDGSLVTLEADPHHAEVAQANIARANLADRVTVLVGLALETLPQLVAAGQAPFDLVFIDADKPNTAAYFAWALKLTRPGSVIIADNVVRNGAVLETASSDPNVVGMRQFHETLAAERRVTATMIQTVGSKGYDGLAIAIVNPE
jgi:predicted O-methyltransferase YrrM